MNKKYKRDKLKKDDFASQYKKQIRLAMESAFRRDETKFIFYAGKAFGILDHVRYEDIIFSGMDKDGRIIQVDFMDHLLELVNEREKERVPEYELAE